MHPCCRDPNASVGLHEILGRLENALRVADMPGTLFPNGSTTRVINSGVDAGAVQLVRPGRESLVVIVTTPSTRLRHSNRGDGTAAAMHLIHRAVRA
jgi:hypothetical protein